MKYLTCEQCDCKIEQTSNECLKYKDLYFCCEGCLHAYMDWSSESISQQDFEMYGIDEDERN